MTLEVWPAELRAWIREHTPRLLSVARAFAAQETEAEDILQEVWWRAARRASSRPAEIPLGAWLVAVTLNVGRDHARRRKRRARLFSIWGPPTAGITAAAEPLHEGTRLWRAVGELPTLQRDVVILRVIEGRSIGETAGSLGRTEGTVKGSLARALATLRAQFDQEIR